MQQKEITLTFDLDIEEERRVYEGMSQLPGFFDEADRTKAFVKFITTMVAAIAQCEQRKEKCENILKAVVGTVPKGKEIWN